MLASKAPVPGGGGASALVGAIGTALASMVANLTVGKKKYAEYDDEIIEITKKAEVLRINLLELINRELMKDREFAVNINEKADAILKEALPRADSVYAKVESSLK